MGWQRVGHDWATFTSLFSSSIIKKKKNLVLVSENFLAKTILWKIKQMLENDSLPISCGFWKLLLHMCKVNRELEVKGNSLTVQWLGLSISTAGGKDSIPDEELRSCMLQWNNNNKKKNGREGNRGKGVYSCYISYTHFRQLWRHDWATELNWTDPTSLTLLLKLQVLL